MVKTQSSNFDAEWRDGMIARCGVSLWLVPALAWTGVCFGDPVAWIMADLFLIPTFLWLYKHLKKEQVR